MTEQQVERIKRDRDRLEERLLKLANIIASREWLGNRTDEAAFLNEKSLHVEFLSVRDALQELERILDKVILPKG